MSHLGNIAFLAHIYCSLYSMLGLGSVVLGSESEYGPDYGTEWLLYVDDNGTTHTMNFSSIPTDTRGFILGDVYFHLYTRRNQQAETLTVPDDNSTMSSVYFNASNDVKVVTHGWLSSDATAWVQKIKTSLLKKDDVNVVLVDWSELADNPFYPWAALSTIYVGKRTAKLLAAIRAAFHVGGERVHLIGHSLGAQVMGYAGMFSSDNVINRITGLDPARPLFEIPLVSEDYRLEKSDAAFVDIIHTCGGIYGYLNSQGHADYYPNSGKPPQPGCEGPRERIEGCSHGRSCEFFEESILSETPFAAYPCESWSRFERGECRSGAGAMGYPADRARLGDYYLHTRAQPPYAIPNETN